MKVRIREQQRKEDARQQREFMRRLSGNCKSRVGDKEGIQSA